MEISDVNKNALADLIRIREEFNSVVESLELMNDSEFMKSFREAKDQIKNGEFADWDEL